MSECVAAEAPWVNLMAPAEADAAVSQQPSTPYSNSSMRPIIRVLAPGVLNTAAS